MLLNLSHLAWSEAEHTPLALQKNKRPSCIWQPNSCADISWRPPTESSRASTPRRHMEIQTHALPTQSVGPGGLILASRLKIKKERHVAQLWDAGKCVCSQPTQITTAERTGPSSSSNTVHQETFSLRSFFLSHDDLTLIRLSTRLKIMPPTPDDDAGDQTTQPRREWNLHDAYKILVISQSKLLLSSEANWIQRWTEMQSLDDPNRHECACFQNINVNVYESQSELDQMEGCRF